MNPIFKNIPLRDKKYQKNIWGKFQGFYNKFAFLPPKKEKKPRKINVIIGSFLALIGVFVVYQITFFAYIFLKNFEIKDVFLVFNDEIKKDENGFTNFLLLGRGGGTHDGPDLTDTMIVASFDPKTNSIVMLSIPRDFYVQTEYYGSSRINEVVRNVKNRLMYQNKFTAEEAQAEGIKLLKKKIEDLTELNLHYYAIIDFSGFKSVVDSLGGIDIEVKNNIVDTTYPADTGWGYQTFSIKKGLQHLDGPTALKYARSRHTTSDFDRALRQQQVIQAIKEKALELKTLTSPTRLTNLIESINQNFETDMNIGELISIAKRGSKIPRENMISKVLVDEPTMEGGFLATPPRDQYGGAFVLIPYAGDLIEIHRYARLLFQSREIYLEKARIEIQNGTKLSGIANKVATKLERYSLKVTSIANTPEKEQFKKTKIIFYNSENYPVTALVLPMLITAETEFITETGTVATDLESEISEKLPEEAPQIIIILGDNYKTAIQKISTPYF